jgi:acrylyl-CoA reductase (NADPH)
MEPHAFGFTLRANASEGQKQFPVSQKQFPISRGVNPLGINSSATPREERIEVWRRIAGDCAPRHLARIATRTIPFAELPAAFPAYLEGQVTGRTVVRIRARP